MRIEYTELMERLGVGHMLSAYESRPWFLHDSEQGIMCSAEVRVGPGHSDVEAEIQFLHDDDKEPEPEEEKEPEKKSLPLIKYGPGGDDEIIDDGDSKDEKEEDEEKKPKRGPILGKQGPEQIMIMRFAPNNDAEWQGLFLIVRGETYHDKIANWDERGSAFFCDFVGALQMNELPNVDELIEEHLVDKRRRGRRGRRGRVGKKGFKVEQKGMTMGMKG